METDDDIAIVGIACRFPGAEDIDDFWRILQNGEDHVQNIPKDRWDITELNIPNLDEEWKQYVQKGGMVRDYDKWDNKFFGVSESEAGWMDPQQCMALEVTHAALENGGFTNESIKGRNVGVYIGVMNNDFTTGISESFDEFNNFLVTGFSPSIISNRLSYHFDIRGPSMTLDTACSSAVVAMHLGAQAIRSGDCEMAICGGVNSILSPCNYLALFKAGMISKTGKCHTFSADADGYVRGEGCGIVILKSLKKAQENGDNIWGVVALGCNQDGKANTPMTAPSGLQQKELCDRLYSRNNIPPSDIQYIETHGTGTPVGDPTETLALAEFFAPYLSPKRRIPIGSVKTNIGHLESSAGTAGIIKVLLMMKYGTIVPSLHYSEPSSNKNIDFQKIPLFVSTTISIWHPHADGSRICCVNCFGFGGTNSHAIVKQLPATILKRKQGHSLFFEYLIAISANSKEALIATTKHYLSKLELGDYKIEDLSFTSVMRRNHYRYRFAVTSNTVDDLKENLNREISSLDEKKEFATIKETKLILIFCGVGTLWYGMCKDMILTNSTFRTAVHEIDQELSKYTNLLISEILKTPPSNFLSDPFVGPITIFATQVGLFRMWVEFGIKPDVIIGQSVGEVAAAYAAECLTLPEAVKVIFFRSQLTAKASGGRMLVVGNCNLELLQKLIDSYDGTLSIAVFSSKETVVLSGDEKAIRDIKAKLSSEEKFSNILLKDLDVTCAYHSHHMKEPSTKLAIELQGLFGKKPCAKVISTVTGKEVTGLEMSSAEYWSKNLLKPVLLSTAVAAAVDEEKNNIFLEIGPKPILRAHLKKITEVESVAIPSCNSPHEKKVFLKAVAAMFRYGYKIKLNLIAPTEGKVTDIPKYQFIRTGRLLISDSVRATLQLDFGKSGTHMFVSRKPLSNQFKVSLSYEKTPYVYEHVVDKMHIAPGAIHVEISLAILRLLNEKPLSETSVSLHFVKPLVVGNGKQKLELDVDVTNENFEIKRKQEILCRGKYFKSHTEDLVQVNLSKIKRMCPHFVNREMIYDTLRNLGLEYGRSLTIISDSWYSNTEYLATLLLPNQVIYEIHKMCLHPCIMDAVLQTLAISWITLFKGKKDTTFTRPIPVRLGAVKLKKEPCKTMYVYGKLVAITPDHVITNILLLSTKGEIIAELENYEVKNRATGKSMMFIKDFSYETRWLHIETNTNYTSVNANTADRTLCISLTKSAYMICQKYLLNESCTKLFIGESTSDYNSHCKRIFDSLESKHISLHDFEQIVYFPGYRQCSDDFDASGLYETIRRSSLVFLTFIQKLIKDSIVKPIYVITEKTQPAIPDIQHMYNVIGAELWGMCRCLVREGTYPNVKLIDIVEEEDLGLLFGIMEKCSDEEFWKYSPEFKISCQKVFVSQIVRINSDTSGLREAAYSPLQSLDLRSKSHQTLEELYFVQKQQNPFDTTSLEMKVDAAVVKHRFSPSTTTLAVEDPHPLKSNRSEGNVVIATEIYGTMEIKEEMTEGNKFLSGRSSKVYPHHEISYVTCLPQTVSNKAFVPSDCAILKQDIPSYEIGMMHKIVLGFALLDEIKPTTPIGIIYDFCSRSDVSSLQKICSSLKYKLDFVSNIEEFMDNVHLTGKYQLIVLVYNVPRIISCGQKISVAASHIFTHSQCMDKPAEQLFRQTFPELEITILNIDSVFSRHTLPRLVKKVKNWLSTNPKFDQNGKEDDDSSNETIFNFLPQTTTSQDNHIFCEVLPVKLDRDHVFNKSAGYMIIGGLTGLGWETTKLIAKMNGGCIAILARSTPNDELLNEIACLSDEYKCRIITLQADISDFKSLKRAFEEYKVQCPSYPLKGVFQGAAVLEDAIVQNMIPEKFEKVLRPKISGTLNLHAVTRDMKLDFFVLHSSITSVIGNTGQINYGAGNAFMDTFAYFRRSIGLSCQTINWGPLHLGLLKTSERIETHLQSQGYDSLQPSEIAECLLHSLSNNIIQIVYGIFRLEVMVRQSPEMIYLRSKLEPLLVEQNLLDLLKKKDPRLQVDIEDIWRLPQECRKDKVNDILCHVAADVFTIELQAIQVGTKFTTLGVDSMKAMAFVNTTYEYFNCRIPFIQVLDPDANIDTISALIMCDIESSLDKSGPTPVNKTLTLESPPEEDQNNSHMIEHDIVTFESEKDNSGIKFEGQLLKETTYGWDHLVALQIKEENAHSKLLQWKNGKKELRVGSIISVKCVLLNGMNTVIIQTDSREYRFKTADKKIFDCLWQQIQGICVSMG